MSYYGSKETSVRLLQNKKKSGTLALAVFEISRLKDGMYLSQKAFSELVFEIIEVLFSPSISSLVLNLGAIILLQ